MSLKHVEAVVSVLRKTKTPITHDQRPRRGVEEPEGAALQLSSLDVTTPILQARVTPFSSGTPVRTRALHEPGP